VLVIAVTGGIGAGKTEAVRYFGSRGAVTLGLDTIAGEALKAGSPALARVAKAFGGGILAADGSLDRPALARAAFASDEATRQLDEIVHPTVVREVESRLRALRESDPPPRWVVLDVPLLVEAPELRAMCDLVLSISAPEEVRLARLAERGMEREDARRRMARQSSDTERAAIAEVVIDNGGDVASLHAALDEFVAREVEPRGA
jgi:dephospho-CoA kinase